MESMPNRYQEFTDEELAGLDDPIFLESITRVDTGDKRRYARLWLDRDQARQNAEATGDENDVETLRDLSNQIRELEIAPDPMEPED